MGDDEEATLRTLTSHLGLIKSQIGQHHGRFVNSAGDSVLKEFASVVEAVNCAVGIQMGIRSLSRRWRRRCSTRARWCATAS
jgi:class 3 adenylate cyclase